jgi:hypothetical protein
MLWRFREVKGQLNALAALHPPTPLHLEITPVPIEHEAR